MTLEISEDTTVELKESYELQEFHREALSSVLECEIESGEIESCVLDVAKLAQIMAHYSSTEEKREGWRRMHR